MEKGYPMSSSVFIRVHPSSSVVQTSSTARKIHTANISVSIRVYPWFKPHSPPSGSTQPIPIGVHPCLSVVQTSSAARRIHAANPLHIRVHPCPSVVQTLPPPGGSTQLIPCSSVSIRVHPWFKPYPPPGGSTQRIQYTSVSIRVHPWFKLYPPPGGSTQRIQ
jgi:hypothetical protein